MWADGSACKGSTADSSFQSHGGDCFQGIEFVPNCQTMHGPGAKTAATQASDGKQPLCECSSGYEAATISEGSWQCNIAVPSAASTAMAVPVWVWVLCVVCLLVSMVSVVIAVRATNKLRSTARGLQQTLVPSTAQW
jgi:hypothetical protein